jgi:P-type Ca2+ transporter type 2C
MGYVLAIHVPIAGISLLPVIFGGPLILLPLHLIFMELIVDPACSVAFEMEPAEADIMRRPPRDPRQRLFDRRLIVRSLLQGGGVLGIAITAFALAFQTGMHERDIRMLTFTSLILGNLALIFTNRSSESLISHRAPNPALRWLALGATLMLALVLFSGPLGDMFRIARPHPADLVIIAAGGLAMVTWVELVKRVARRS